MPALLANVQSTDRSAARRVRLRVVARASTLEVVFLRMHIQRGDFR